MPGERTEVIDKLFEKIDKLVEDTHAIKMELAVQNQYVISLIAGVRKDVEDVKKKSNDNSDRILILETAATRAKGWGDVVKIIWGAGGVAIGAIGTYLRSKQ